MRERQNCCAGGFACAPGRLPAKSPRGTSEGDFFCLGGVLTHFTAGSSSKGVNTVSHHCKITSWLQRLLPHSPTDLWNLFYFNTQSEESSANDLMQASTALKQRDIVETKAKQLHRVHLPA